MAEHLGPIPLSAEQVAERVPANVPGSYALGHARPQEGAVFISFVGRSDGDLQAAILAHVGGPYTACFWLPAASPEEAYRAECVLWHDLGGPGGDLHSGLHPVPPGDFPCPQCG